MLASPHISAYIYIPPEKSVDPTERPNWPHCTPTSPRSLGQAAKACSCQSGSATGVGDAAQGELSFLGQWSPIKAAAVAGRCHGPFAVMACLPGWSHRDLFYIVSCLGVYRLISVCVGPYRSLLTCDWGGRSPGPQVGTLTRCY